MVFRTETSIPPVPTGVVNYFALRAVVTTRPKLEGKYPGCITENTGDEEPKSKLHRDGIHSPPRHTRPINPDVHSISIVWLWGVVWVSLEHERGLRAAS